MMPTHPLVVHRFSTHGAKVVGNGRKEYRRILVRGGRELPSLMNKRDEHRITNTINVQIVDDHPLFREGLQKALDLEDDIFVVGHSESGEKALEDASQWQPDVILLDVNLPGMNGLQVARQLKVDRADAAIVMLTAYHDTQQVLYAMRAGASAYCPKNIKPEDLVRVIRDAASGFYVVGEKRMDRRTLDDWIQTNVAAMTGPYVVDSEDHFIPLSPRETEILQSVTRGMSNKEIATKLGISQQTVKNHMTSILRKLNVVDRTQAAVTALRHGWVRIDDPEN